MLNAKEDTINRKQMLFGINQGGVYPDLRINHMKEIAKLNLDGYAIGGLAVGETAEEMYEIIDAVEPFMPEDKPRYLMGVGTPVNIVEAVAVKVTPSVVGIRTTTSVVSFFGGGNEQMGEGSGVIYSSDGYIITNYHVIADAISNSGGKIEVFLDSDTEKSHTAQVVGYNISTDLAVIKIDAKGLQKAEIGNSDELKLGQYVITVGNPGGLEFMDSVTYGVISGLDRIVSSDSDLKLIQTDAAINPGNSGGALVNAKGQLVGINSSKIVSEEYEGMGFAIPVKKVIEVCDGIIERENAPEPYVGISISERYTADVLSFYGYPTGAVVLSVAETSPAENAGIRRGDIITKFKGTTLNSYEMFEQLLSECSPGEKVNAEIYRSGKYYSTEITIGSNS